MNNTSTSSSLEYKNPNYDTFLSSWRIHTGLEGLTNDYSGMYIELSTSNCSITTSTSVKPYLGLFYCEFITASSGSNTRGIIINPPLPYNTQYAGNGDGNEDNRGMNRLDMIEDEEERGGISQNNQYPQMNNKVDGDKDQKDVGVAIGVSKGFGGTTKPGWSKDSIGYSSSDGCIYMNAVRKSYNKGYKSGDAVGILISFIDRTLAFTLNGTLLETTDFLVYGQLKIQISNREPCSLLVVPQEEFAFDISSYFFKMVKNISLCLRPNIYTREEIIRKGCEKDEEKSKETELDFVGFFNKNWGIRERTDVSPSVKYNDIAHYLACEMLETSTQHETDWKENVVDCINHGDTRSAIMTILEHGGTKPLKYQDRHCDIFLPSSYPISLTHPILDPIKALVFGIEDREDARETMSSSSSPSPTYDTKLTVSSPRLARLFLETALILSNPKYLPLSSSSPCDPDLHQLGLLKLEAIGYLCGTVVDNE